MAHSKNTRNWSVREFKELLRINGYILTRSKGDHLIFTKPNCIQHISIPATQINMMVARRLIKENNLDTTAFIK